MIDQLNSLSSSMKVSFILCDLQSWDISTEEFENIRQNTLSDLQAVLSPEVDIILESDIP